MPKYVVNPTPPVPRALAVYECDDCHLAVAWPAGFTPIPAMQCRHFVPRSTSRKTWSRALVAPTGGVS